MNLDIWMNFWIGIALGYLILADACFFVDAVYIWFWKLPSEAAPTTFAISADAWITTSLLLISLGMITPFEHPSLPAIFMVLGILMFASLKLSVITRQYLRYLACWKGMWNTKERALFRFYTWAIGFLLGSLGVIAVGITANWIVWFASACSFIYVVRLHPNITDNARQFRSKDQA